MKFISIVFTAFFLMVGCASQTQTPPKQADVLILTPQGVAPASDTVGFNGLVRNVTQAFSKEFSVALQSKNLSHINVLDQNPTYDNGQKLAIYALKHKAHSVVMLTIATENHDNEEQMLLHIQFIQLEPAASNGQVTSVKPASVLDRKYLLRGSKSGDSPYTIEDLVADYVNFLKEKNRIN